MFKRLFSSAPVEDIILDNIKFSLKHTVRKNMKRMILRVRQRHQIELSSSSRSQQKLLSFIEEQKEWILLQHRALQEPFGEESSFYYLSQVYSVRHHSKPLTMAEGLVYLNPLSAKTQSDNFYKKMAQQMLPSRIELYSKKMGLEYEKLRFHCAKSRWGSCSSKGVITLNPYMMKLSEEMIDYIIVHELAHLSHMNHSKAFYALVAFHVPEYKRIQKEISTLSRKMLSK